MAKREQETDAAPDYVWWLGLNDVEDISANMCTICGVMYAAYEFQRGGSNMVSSLCDRCAQEKAAKWLTRSNEERAPGKTTTIGIVGQYLDFDYATLRVVDGEEQLTIGHYKPRKRRAHDASSVGE